MGDPQKAGGSSAVHPSAPEGCRIASNDVGIVGTVVAGSTTSDGRLSPGDRRDQSPRCSRTLVESPSAACCTLNAAFLICQQKVQSLLQSWLLLALTKRVSDAAVGYDDEIAPTRVRIVAWSSWSRLGFDGAVRGGRIDFDVLMVEGEERGLRRWNWLVAFRGWGLDAAFMGFGWRGSRGLNRRVNLVGNTKRRRQLDPPWGAQRGSESVRAAGARHRP